jgi:hypothetical protein
VYTGPKTVPLLKRLKSEERSFLLVTAYMTVKACGACVHRDTTRRVSRKLTGEGEAGLTSCKMT